MAALSKIEIGPTLRPCLARGRRAFFHRWADSARAALPKEVTETEELRHFQLYSVHGIVEYEDGVVDRVWPFDIQFLDGGHFADYDWDAMERAAEQQNEEPLPFTIAPIAEV